MSQQSSTVQQFMWKVRFLLGETILNVQNRLISKQVLNQCLLIQHPQLQRIIHNIIEESQKVPLSKVFLKIKSLIKGFYHHKSYSMKKLISLYSEFTKISRQPLKFDLVFKYLSIKQQQKKRKQQIERNKFNVTYLTKYYKDGQIAQIQQVAPQSTGPKLGGTINKKEKVVETILIADDGDRGFKNRWSPSQQAIFCKIYAETDSPAICVRLMEKQLGPDVRWKAVNQIQSKIAFIVTKVFNKVATLTTNNEYIKTFRDNKKVVFGQAKSEIRKKIFRNIAIIYESMLNINEQKKALITQKILEVNRLCQDVKHMT